MSQPVRIFVSSPADAQFERMRVDRVVERLNGEFAGVARLETIRWEREFYKAHTTFQDQIPQAADCDIVVAILRHRLGTELPDDFPPMPNGERYPSGTAYEVLTAIEARRARELPDVYVFRYPSPPTMVCDDDKNNALIQDQWVKVKSFFDAWFRTPEGHFKAAFHEFRSTDEFESQVELLLRKWLEEKILKGRSVVWPIETKGSPFRGLAAFGHKHAPVFFGRKRDIAKATDAIKDAAGRGVPFLLVVGASGSGKSSLAHAGLVPRLTTPGVVPTVDAWRVAMMRPSEHADGPLAALAASLFEDETDLGEEEEGRPVALPELKDGAYGAPVELADLLSHGGESALKPILHALDKVSETEREKSGFERPVRADLLLVVDQLDELFAAELSEERRQAFASILALLAATGRVWIIATLRADLYERFLKLPQLLELKTGGASFDVAAPSTTELDEIVRAPAAAAGLLYETDPETGETLDDQLLRDADQPDMLPLLQFTLDQLFEQRQTVDGETRLTFAAYQGLGGLAGAIDKQAERAVAALGTAEIEALPKLMRLLVAQRQDGGAMGSGAGLMIRSVSLSEADTDPPLRKLVDALVGARILVMSNEGDQVTVRLVHQRIVESWDRARRVVEENADFFRILSDVKAQLRRWVTSGGHPSTILPKGQPLREARSLAHRFGDELEPRIRHFIDASRWRQAVITLNIRAAPFFIIGMVLALILENTKVLSSDISLIGIMFMIFVVWPLSASGIFWVFRRHALRLIAEAARTMGFESALRYRSYLITANTLLVTAITVTSILIFFMVEQVRAIAFGPESANNDSFDTVGGAAVAILMFFFACWAITSALLSRRIRRSVASSSGGDTLRFKPILVLVGLAVISGFAAWYAMPGTIFISKTLDIFTEPRHYAVAVPFALVVAFGEYFWGRSSRRASLLILPAVILSWLAAFTVSYLAFQQYSSMTAAMGGSRGWLALLSAGIVAGGIGALLTALSIPTLRIDRRWSVAMAIGGASGIFLVGLEPMGGGYTRILLFVAWQVSFAAYFGYCLGSLQPAAPQRLAFHEPSPA